MALLPGGYSSSHFSCKVNLHQTSCLWKPLKLSWHNHLAFSFENGPEMHWSSVFFPPNYIQKIPREPSSLTLKDKFTKQKDSIKHLTFVHYHIASYVQGSTPGVTRLWCWCDCCMDHDHLSSYLLITPYPTPRLLLLNSSDTVPNFSKIMVVIMRRKKVKGCLVWFWLVWSVTLSPPTLRPQDEMKSNISFMASPF